MPRLPKLPGGNPPTTRDAFVEAVAAGAAQRLEIDLLTSLVSAGFDALADQLMTENSTSVWYESVRLAWMAHCTKDDAYRTKWAEGARAAWEKLREREPAEDTLARQWSAMALIADDPDAALEAALAGKIDHHSILEPVMTLLALGRLDEAIDVLEQRGEAVKRGLGWSTGIMERYDEGFIENLLRRLVDEERWDLLGRVCALSEKHDGAFLSAVTLSTLLTDREDATDALAVVSPTYLRRCFLHTLSRVPAHTHASFAPLVERLPPHRRAIAEVLLGDPSKADALLAEEDQHGRKWDPIIVAILRDDEDAFDAVTGWDEWALRRTSIGAIRALSVKGDDAALRKWADILHATSEQVREKDRPHVLADLGRELCVAGARNLGELILMEAFEMAHAMERSSDQGWSRNNALGAVGCNAARAGAWQAALKSMQKCTSKYNRPDIARELALAYARIGDFGGAKQTHSFIKPDQTGELYKTGLILIGALAHGLDGRFNQTRSA